MPRLRCRYPQTSTRTRCLVPIPMCVIGLSRPALPLFLLPLPYWTTKSTTLNPSQPLARIHSVCSLGLARIANSSLATLGTLDTLHSEKAT